MEIILKGAFIGFVIAFPVGPVAAIVLRVGVAHGPFYGFAAAMGAASADAVFGAIAAFGITQAGDLLTEHQLEFRVVGLLVMLGIAIRLLSVTPIDPANAPASKRPGVFGPFLATWFLVLANPITLIAFASVLAAAGVHEMRLTVMQGLILTGSVFLGAALCWSGVSVLAAIFRHRVNAAVMAGINFVTAVMLIVFSAMISISIISPESMPLFATPDHL